MTHEHRAGETTSLALDRRKRYPGEEPRGTEVLEAIMAGVVIAVAVFLGGIMVGVMAVIALSVHREDRRRTLASEAPGRLSRSTRRLNGLARRDLDPEFLRPARELVH